jgi:uncharacterized protein YoxC
MNQLWLALIAGAVVAIAGFLIALLIELRKVARSFTKFLNMTGESTKTTLEELQQTLKSLRSVSDDIQDVTDDVKTFSGAVKDVGQNIQQINNVLEKVTSSALVEASSLKAGIRTAFTVLSSNFLNNLFKRGGKQ